VIPTKQRDDINQPVELGLWVALDNGCEDSKQALDSIRAHQKWQLPNGKRPMNLDVLFKRMRQSNPSVQIMELVLN